MIDSPLFPYAFALLIAVPFLIFLRQFVHYYIKTKEKELKLLTVKSNNAQKLQAYERMTLFLERLKPANLVTKFDRNLASHEFIFLTEKTIQEEFDYNASQQLFVTKTSWQNIVNSKNNLIHLLHETYGKMSNESTLEDFKTIFLMNYVNGEDYIGNSIETMRREILMLN